MSRRTLILLALLLLACAAEFLWRGRPALVAENKAHADLLRRERAIAAMEAGLAPDAGDELRALLTDRDRLAALARRRLEVVQADSLDVRRPGLEEVIAENQDRALARETRLGESVRRAAQASPQAEQALALLVGALGSVRGVEALELTDGGQPLPVPGVPELEQVQAELVLTTSLPNALAVLERLAPAPGAGLPLLGVLTASLRRIEPERWGTGLHLLQTPPVRLQVTVAIVFSATAKVGS